MSWEPGDPIHERNNDSAARLMIENAPLPGWYEYDPDLIVDPYLWKVGDPYYKSTT